MSVPPERPERWPIEEPARPGEVERERTDIAVVSILGGLALILAVSMWFYTKDRQMIASDGTVVKQTTGSAVHESPVPSAPRLPEPAPQQQ